MTVQEDANPEDNELCADYRGLLVRAADGALDDNEGMARLASHLAGCSACRAALEAQRLAHLATAAAYDADPSPEFAAAVLAGLHPREHALDGFDFRQWTWRIGPVAAGLTLAAWMVVTTSQPTVESVAADPLDTDTASSAVLWSDAMSDADSIALIWEGDVDPGSDQEEAPQ